MTAPLEILAPGIRRLCAPNPSAMTGTGTNSYIVGTGTVAVIDPGPDLPAHLDAILCALSPAETVSHILVTHAHQDHSALAARLATRTGARILAHGSAAEGRSAVMTGLAASLPGGGEGLDLTFQPHQRLRHGDIVTGPDWSLRTLHTPGHLGGHLCFGLGQTLFSGDHVMAWSSSLISPPDGDMAAYMASLRGLLTSEWSLFLPGHGPRVADPAAQVQSLIRHRLNREAQLLRALDQTPTPLGVLTQRVYTDTAPGLLAAAERNCLAHLIDLHDRNLVAAVTVAGSGTLFAGR